MSETAPSVGSRPFALPEDIVVPLGSFAAPPMTGSAARRIAIALVFLVAAGCRRTPAEPATVVPQVNPVQPRRVAFSPVDDDRLLVLEASGLVGVWNVADAAHPVRLAWIPAGAIDASFAADGKGVLTCGWDGTVRSWTADGRLAWTSAGAHEGPARAVAAGTDVIVSGGEDGALRFWNRDGSEKRKPVAAHDGLVVSVAISPAGDVASAGTDGTIRLWRADASRAEGDDGRVLDRASRQPGNLVHQIKHSQVMGWDHALAFSPASGALAGAGFDAKIHLWQGRDSEPALLFEGQRTLRSLDFSAAGNVLAAVGFDGRIQLWNGDGSHPRALGEHPQTSLSVALTRRGDRLATACIDDRVRLWKPGRGMIGVLPADERGMVAAATVREGRPMIAVADRAGRVRRWEPGTPLTARRLGGNRRKVAALAFSPRDGTLAVGADDGRVRLWRRDGSVAELRPSFETYVDEVAFSSAGDLIAAASTRGKIELLHLDGSVCTPYFRVCSEVIHGISFAPTADRFAVVCDDGRVRGWTLEGTEPQPLLGADAGAARGLASSADGRLLASGGLDGMLRVWTMPQLELRTALVGLPIQAVGFHEGGIWVAANGDTVLFFDPELQIVATATATADAILLSTPDGWFTGSKGAGRSVRVFRRDGTDLGSREAAARLSSEKVVAAFESDRE